MCADSLSLDITLQRPGFALQIEHQFELAGTTAIFGASGAGKSTLLRAIAGFESELSGSIRYGQEVWHERRPVLAPHRRSFGFVFQNSQLFPHLDVRGNLDFAWQHKRQAWPDKRYEDIVEGFELGSLLSQRPGQLSGGQQRRVAMARALLCAPAFLMLDEPLTGLDVESKARLLPFIRQIRSEFAMPMLYVSHDIDEVMYLADKLVVLANGRVEQQAQGDAMLSLLQSADEKAAGDNLLSAAVVALEPELSIAKVDVQGHTIDVAQAPAMSVGQTIRLKVMASDIAIALKPIVDISIRNQLKVTVDALAVRDDSPYCDLNLRLGQQQLNASITTRSAKALDLQVGQQVWALIKSARVQGYY